MTEPRYHLAQVNIALPVAPLDSARLQDFVSSLDSVNAVADASPGFVWRLKTEDGNATSIRAFADERLIVNMSVWESMEALQSFVYRSQAHAAVLRRRQEWFAALGQMHMALWWVPAGHLPSIAEAEERLADLRRNGPTAETFTFKSCFPAPSEYVHSS